jgi:hypothetical protein
LVVEEVPVKCKQKSTRFDYKAIVHPKGNAIDMNVQSDLHLLSEEVFAESGEYIAGGVVSLNRKVNPGSCSIGPGKQTLRPGRP